MNIQLNEEEIQELIKKTVVSRVTSYVDKYFKENKYIFNDQIIERYIREAIDSRVWDISVEKFDEAIKNTDKQRICEALAHKMYEYLFENY